MEAAELKKTRMGIISTILLFLIILLIACNRDSPPPFPKASEVDSIAFHISALNPELDPKPLLTKNANDKLIIDKLINYLHAAKSEGYDKKVPFQSVPTNFATITCTDGSGLSLNTGGNDIVYVQEGNDIIRIISPELSNWLWKEWQNDLAVVKQTKKKISIADAKKLILATQYFSQSINTEFELVEITPTDIWDKTMHQLFKIVGGSNWETFIVTNQEAIHIGNGFGGFGVTSTVPYDVNKDGTMDIVYAYSFGSGIHRSIISWIDLKSFTEHIVGNMPERTGFRTYDLILKVEKSEIVVYRIAGFDESKINFYSMITYPTNKDIDYMTLEKDGTLVWENNDLYNNYVD
jgi:hypothetical protein